MGYEVVCTPQQCIALEGGGWIKAQECAGKLIRLQPPMFANHYNVVEWNILPGGVKGTVEINEEWGRLLGYYMGDGSFYGATLSIACNSTDADVVTNVEQLVTRLIGTPRSRVVGTKSGGIEVRIERKELKPLFEALGISYICEHSNNTKRAVRVPECIWRSPKSVVKEFLRALFESDGFAGYGFARVSLFSKHHELLRGVQTLLLGFGVTARYSSLPAKNGSGFLYQANTLDLRREESCLFGKDIGFISERKQDRVLSWINRAASGIGRNRKPLHLFDRVVSIDDAGQSEVACLTVPAGGLFDAGGILVCDAYPRVDHNSRDKE